MASIAIDVSHGCEGGGEPVDGLVPVHQAARSSCCGEVLAEGGTDEAGYHCTACSQPCQKVMGEPTAHWTCKCGTKRSQVITQPQDVA